MPKRKKGSLNVTPAETSSFENSSSQINIELDNKALRVKNGNLAQANARLQAEKAQMQVQITQLQEDCFKQHSTFTNLKNVLYTIESSIKTTLIPKLFEISDVYEKLAQLCSIGKDVSVTKDPRMLAVQPHTVNGHVLQHPTISLSRLNSASNGTPPRQRSNQSISTHQENLSRQRTESDSMTNTANQNGTTEESQERLVDNENNDQNEYGIERIIYRRRRNIPIEPMNIEALEQQEDEEILTEHDISESCSRLLTIREEDEDVSSNSPISTIVSREVKIYIDRLPSDFVRRNGPHTGNINRTLKSTDSIDSSLDGSRQKSFNHSTRSNGSTRHTGASHSKNRIEVVCNGNSASSFLDDDSTSNATLIEETVYRRTMSPLKRREARYFGEANTFLQSSNGSTMRSLSVRTLQKDKLEMSKNLSAIENMPSCSLSHVRDASVSCNSVQCDKMILLDNLGLSPSVPGIATSTPMTLSPMPQTGDQEWENSKIDNSTPKKNTKISKINMKRGGSNDVHKIAQVVLKRITLEKNVSGPSVKKISDILNVPVITRNSRIAKRKITTYADESSSSPSSSSENVSKSDSKENVDTSNKNVTSSRNSDSIIEMRSRKPMKLSSPSDSNTEETQNDTVSYNRHVRIPIVDIGQVPAVVDNKGQVPAKSNAKPATTKVIKRAVRSPIGLVSHVQFKQSPRPKRAARPQSLKEPTLNKKMRRSK